LFAAQNHLQELDALVAAAVTGRFVKALSPATSNKCPQAPILSLPFSSDLSIFNNKKNDGLCDSLRVEEVNTSSFEFWIPLIESRLLPGLNCASLGTELQ
jgi:hypothetical protein